MPQYHWKGIDTQGTTHKGMIALESESRLRAHLLEKKIALLSFRRKTKKKFFLKTTQTNIANFFYHLRVLLKSSIPLIQALKLAKNYANSQELQNNIDIIIQKIESGKTLSDAMAGRVPFFSPLMIQIIRSGERANRLHESCKNLSAYLTKRRELIKKLKQAALLPTITLIFSMAIILALFLFVIPQFQPMLMERESQLPASTKLIFAISNGLRSEQYKILIVLALVMLLFFFRFIRKHTKITLPPRLMLSLPVIGKLIVLSNLIQFTQTLSLLLKSGIPLSQALHLASDGCTNRHLRETVQKIRSHIDAGQLLHQACRSVDSAYLPESLLAAIDVGEQTGKLEPMLDTSMQLLETQLNARTHTLVTMFQPVLLVVTGLIIAFLLLSIYLPLFNFS